MNRINWSAPEIRVTLVEREPSGGKEPRVKRFSVYSEFGNPRLRLVQQLDATLPGPLVWLWAENEHDRSCRVPFGGTLATRNGSGTSFETYAQPVADLINAMLSADAVKRVVVCGSDRREWVVSAECAGAEAKDQLGDVSDNLAQPEYGEGKGSLRDEF